MTEYFGYAGKILHVDLTSGEVSREPLDMTLAERFVGGWGINFRLIWDLLKPGAAPFAPESPIIIGAGTLVGTLAPSSSKFSVTMKFPSFATADGKNAVASSTAGSQRFGIMLKNAGYDHVIITGKAKKPSYLRIDNDEVRICDATALWGKADIYETMYALKKKYPGSGVWAIGRGGENLVRMALGFVDRSHLGLGGGAAVLGSKNLKAVVVSGSKGIRVADPKRFLKAVDRTRESVLNRTICRDIAEYEGPGHFAAMTSKYARAYPAELFPETNIDCLACTACLCPCRCTFTVKDGEFAGSLMQFSHYVLVPYIGQHLRLLDYREAMKLLEVLNRAGLGRETFCHMVNFILKMYESGKITEKETDSLIPEATLPFYLKLVEMILRREGLGAAMADGWYALRQKLGVDPWSEPDGVCIFKGIDASHDLRTRQMTDWQFQKSVNPRGAVNNLSSPSVHVAGLSPAELKTRSQKTYHLSDADINRIFTEDNYNVGRMAKYVQDFLSVFNCVGVCASPATVPSLAINIEKVAEFYSAATGIEVDADELRQRGERVWNLHKLLSVREGFTREDDVFPAMYRNAIDKPLRLAGDEGLRTSDYGEEWSKEKLTSVVVPRDYFGHPVTREDLDRWLADFYDERGWDPETGLPTQKKLAELGLDEFAPDRILK